MKRLPFRAAAMFIPVFAVGVLGCSKVHQTDAVESGLDAFVATDGSFVADAFPPGPGDSGPPPVLDASLDGTTIDASRPAMDAATDGAPLVDVCSSADDMAGLALIAADFQVVFQNAIPCFIQSMGGPVFVGCVANSLSDFVSADCGRCVGEQADCLVSSCLTICIGDPGGSGCTDCVCSAGCVDGFKTCSGVDFDAFQCP